MRSTLVFAIVLGAATSSGPAFADNAPAAETLFNEGKRLSASGRWAEACLKFEESQRVDPGIGTLFQLANCHEQVGRTASAWAEFREVAASAKAIGQTAREQVARQRASALETKLARLTVSVDSDAMALTVRRDGQEVGRAQWGTAIAIDPGTHRVDAKAPGRKAWEQVLKIDHAQQLTVRVPALESERTGAAPVAAVVPAAPAPAQTAPPAPAPVATSSAPLSTDSPAPPAEGAGGSGQRIAGGVVFGVGVAALGVGTAFGLMSKSARDESEPHCRGDRCNATGLELRDDAMTRGNISTVAFGVGAAGVITGAVLFFTAKPNAAANNARLGISPLATAGGGGFSVRGGF